MSAMNDDLREAYDTFHKGHDKLREELMGRLPSAIPPATHTWWLITLLRRIVMQMKEKKRIGLATALTAVASMS